MVEFFMKASRLQLQQVQHVPAQGHGFVPCVAMFAQSTRVHRLAWRACLTPVPHKTAPAWRGAAPAVHPDVRWQPEPCPPALNGSRQGQGTWQPV